MKDFPKAPEKFREAKGTDFGKRQFHPRKPKQERKQKSWEARDAKRAQKGRFSKGISQDEPP